MRAVQQIPITEGLLLASTPAIAYGLAYAREMGFASALSIPTGLVSVTTTGMLYLGILLACLGVIVLGIAELAHNLGIRKTRPWMVGLVPLAIIMATELFLFDWKWGLLRNGLLFSAGLSAWVCAQARSYDIANSIPVSQSQRERMEARLRAQRTGVRVFRGRADAIADDLAQLDTKMAESDAEFAAVDARVQAMDAMDPGRTDLVECMERLRSDRARNAHRSGRYRQLIVAFGNRLNRQESTLAKHEDVLQRVKLRQKVMQEQFNTPAVCIMSRFSPVTLGIFVVLILAATISFDVGRAEAFRTRRYLVIEGKTPLAVLRVYGDRIVAASYDPATHELTGAISVLRLDSEKIPSMRYKDIGPLKSAEK